MSEAINSLEPPGSIVVIGSGPLGIETALYGRFLGYQVTLVHERSLEEWLTDDRDNDLPVLPDRCLSSLAKSALDAQYHELGPQALPMKVAQWLDNSLQAVCESDLLRQRVRSGQAVVNIEMMPAQQERTPAQQEKTSEEQAEPDSKESEIEVPDDFRITLGDETMDCEALILVSERNQDFKAMLPIGVAYCFTIEPFLISDMEASLTSGYHQIARIFSELMDRDALDLYRPKRG